MELKFLSNAYLKNINMALLIYLNDYNLYFFNNKFINLYFINLNNQYIVK